MSDDVSQLDKTPNQPNLSSTALIPTHGGPRVELGLFPLLDIFAELKTKGKNSLT